jgi:repressor LexA
MAEHQFDQGCVRVNHALRDVERRLLDYLARAGDDREDSIPVEELQLALGISHADVRACLRKLERLGYLRANPSAPSGFEVLRAADGSVPVRRRPYGGSGLTWPSDRLADARARPDPGSLPARQRQAYTCICRRVEQGLPPTTRELKAELGLASVRDAHDLIHVLERKGFIRLLHEPGDPSKRRKARGIQLVDPEPAVSGVRSTAVYLPVMGRVAAGDPAVDESGEAAWEELARELIELPRELLGGNDPFRVVVIDVEGDSMIGDGVLDGDRLLVLRQQEATEGDLVVARFFNEATRGFELTVKRYRLRRGHPWLLPANPNYQPIDGEKADLVGRVIGLLRYPL